MPDTIAPDTTRGGNHPPELLPPELVPIETLGEQFAAAIAEVKTRLAELRVSFSRIPTTKVVTGKNARNQDFEEEVLDAAADPAVAEKVTMLLAQTKLATDDLKKLHRDWKDPFRHRADAIQEAYNQTISLVSAVEEKTRRLLGAHQQRIQRQQQEEARAAQAKADAEAAAAREAAAKLEAEAAEKARAAQTEEQRAEAARTAEAAVKATASAEKAEKKAETAANADTRGHVRTAGALAQKPRTHIEITIDDADEVPRGYCSPDMALLRGAIEAGVKKIPGVTWKEVPLASVKSR